jgi:UDPglucose 6-dehydrogenase
VGTCRAWREQLDGANRGLLIAHAPENLRLGRALEDFLHPARLLIGADDDASFAAAAKVLEPLGVPPTRLSLSSAEMAKHATNAYLALCIAFANELAVLSLEAGADPTEVIEALREDPRVSPSAPLRPGTAFSGATLIRDLTTLTALGEAAGRPDLFAAVIKSNDRHAALAADWLEEELAGLTGRRIAVAGLTYKPGTSTLRDSLPLRVVGQLLHRGASVRAWDPLAEEFDGLAGFTRVDSLEASVMGVDALVVLTALPELREVDWSGLRPVNRLVIDVCSVVDAEAAAAAGWSYRGLVPA